MLAYCKRKKELYYAKIQAKMSDVKSPKDICNTVKSVNKKERETCHVSKVEWEGFYENAVPQNRPPQNSYYGTYCDIYDTDITPVELATAIKSLKTGKSSGNDGVTNELLKNLPPNWMQAMLGFLQGIFKNESVPTSLTDITITMLHKKGSKEDLNNYRGISLINTILKLYTAIKLQRLQKWAETNKVLPESQAGFRKGRGCRDHIFTLNSLRQISFIKRRKRKLHLLFVDFARAFDSIKHSKLWAKLYKLGVSSKLIRILSDIYGKA